MRSVLIFLTALLCLTQAYVSPMKYYTFGTIRADYQTLGGSQTIRGLQTMTYDAESRSLTFTIVSNLQTVGAVELRGPAACREFGAGVIGWRSLTSAFCIANTGPVQFTLGRGTSPTTDNNPVFQAFRGTLALSAEQESMLFEGELYVVMNSYVTGTTPNTFIETPTLRGPVNIYSQEQYNYQVYQNNRVYLLLNFVANDGSFSSQGKSNTQSTGTGVLSFFLQDGAISNRQLTVDIFTTIATPGNYLLVCGGVSLSLNNGNTNPNPLTTTLTLTAEQSVIFLELVAEKRCYIFITSSAFPDGDLYSWIQVPSSLQSTLTGAGQKTPVASAYYARSFFFFDFGAKSLTHFTFHNITDTITQAFFELENGTMICNATGTLNNPSNIGRTCYVNESYVPFVADGKVYMNIYTVTNPNGEVRGKVAFSGKSSGSIGVSAGPVNAVAIGLGVGLGLLAVIALAAAVFFFMKSRGGSKGI